MSITTLNRWRVLAGLSCWLAIMVAAVPASLAAEREAQPQIRVTGEGVATLEPDMALLHLTVAREAATAREALDANSAAMRDVLAALRAAGIAERDLQTAQFSIQPRFRHPPRRPTGEQEPPQIVGYMVSNSLTVRVRDLSKLGSVLDTSVSLGVNQGGGIQFLNDDPSAALAQARAEAVRDALARARVLTEAAGVRLGRILEISEQSYQPRPLPMARAELMMAAADAVPVAGGENSYQVSVSVVLAIEQ